MTHRSKFLFVFILSVTFLTFSFVPSLTFADTKIVETSFFGNLKDDGQGCGVYTVLDFVLSILTIGVGILGVIGILVVGAMYLTARGNEERTKKAKTRILEIMIGLAAYAVIYAVLAFLLPQFSPDIAACQQATQADIKAQEAKEAEEKAMVSERSNLAKNKKDKKTNESSEDTGLSEWYKAMDDQADYMKSAKYGGNYKSNFKESKKRGTCVTYVSTALQRLGVIPKNTFVWYNGKITGTAKKSILNNKDVFSVSYPNKTPKQLYNQGKLKKGDIIFYEGHTMIFTKIGNNGKPLFHTFGKKGMKKNYAHSGGSKKIRMLIHLKKASK